LVVLGVAAGAALGIATRHPSSSPSPAQWVAALLTATEEAGSAHFTYSHLTSSPNPDLRETLRGHGVVDFVRGAVQASEIDHSVTFSSTNGQPFHPVHTVSITQAIVVDGTDYQRPVFAGVAVPNVRYIKLPELAAPSRQRALSLALNASVALGDLTGPFPIIAVRDLGPSVVGRAPTTHYSVVYGPVRSCLPHAAPVVAIQPPTTVWVDAAGRLVQAHSVYQEDTRVLPHGPKLPPAVDGFPRGRSTTVSTLTFSDFGVPIRVTAPAPDAVLPQHLVGGMASSTFRIAGHERCPL
jgi:hypothetical protein